MQVKISTFSNQKSYNQCCVFVLSVGNNSGKVLENPCPNCFVIECLSIQQKALYKNLVSSLFKASVFEEYYVGSVYNFLRLSDFTKIIRENERLLTDLCFKKSVSQLELLEKLQKQYLNNLSLIQDAQRALARKIIKNRL